MPTHDKTSAVLLEMLKENTGTHMLDSGGAYGRQWQRNQSRDIAKEPDCHFKIDIYEHNGEKRQDWDYGMSTYHFLLNALTYDAKMNAKFQAYNKRKENDDKGYLEIMEDFVDTRNVPESKYDINRQTINTYNHESLLDQVLQYIYWKDPADDCEYVLLQIHGGCDVRGGYTRPRVFRTEDYKIMNDDQMYFRCDGNGTSNQIAIDGKVHECQAGWNANGGMIYGDDSETPDGKDMNTLELSEDGIPTCPVCGKGKIYACPAM